VKKKRGGKNIAKTGRKSFWKTERYSIEDELDYGGFSPGGRWGAREGKVAGVKECVKRGGSKNLSGNWCDRRKGRESLGWGRGWFCKWGGGKETGGGDRKTRGGSSV